MKLRMIGTTSGGGNCPALYEADNGDIVVQGQRLTDPVLLTAVIAPSPLPRHVRGVRSCSERRSSIPSSTRRRPNSNQRSRLFASGCWSVSVSSELSHG